MPNKTPIEWTDYSSNPIYAVNKETGKRGWFCVKVSPGCGHCYAESINVGWLGNKLHYTESNIDKVEFVLNEKELLEIIKLNDRLAKKGEIAKMFLMDMSDLFLEAIPDEFIDKIFATAALCPNITFQILTKHAQRMRDYFLDESLTVAHGKLAGGRPEAISAAVVSIAKEYPDEIPFPLPNVWLGVSCENQKTAGERIPYLLETPAAIRFLSCEPLLEEIDLTKVSTIRFRGAELLNSLTGVLEGLFGDSCSTKLPGVDWIIVGGESGAGARRCDLTWMTSIVQQCQGAGVKVFVKQLGAQPTQTFNEEGEFVHFHAASRKGGDIEEFPKHLQIREIPEVTRLVFSGKD